MEKVWYYMRRADHSKYGPYSDHELAALIHQGILEADDYIWTPALKGWLRVGDTIYSAYMPVPGYNA